MNPLLELRNAAEAAALNLTGVGHAEPYDGQEHKDLARAAVMHRAAGASMFVRVWGGEVMDQAPQGKDRSETMVHWIAAVPRLEGVDAASDAALGVLWLAYDELVGRTLGLDWIWPLTYRGWQTVYQAQSCCVVSLVTGTWIDMAAFRR